MSCGETYREVSFLEDQVSADLQGEIGQTPVGMQVKTQQAKACVSGIKIMHQVSVVCIRVAAPKRQVSGVKRTDGVLVQLLCKAHKAQEAGKAVHLSPQLVPKPGQGVWGHLPSTDPSCQQESELLHIHSTVYVCLQGTTRVIKPHLDMQVTASALAFAYSVLRCRRGCSNLCVHYNSTSFLALLSKAAVKVSVQQDGLSYLDGDAEHEAEEQLVLLEQAPAYVAVQGVGHIFHKGGDACRQHI